MKAEVDSAVFGGSHLGAPQERGDVESESTDPYARVLHCFNAIAVRPAVGVDGDAVAGGDAFQTFHVNRTRVPVEGDNAAGLLRSTGCERRPGVVECGRAHGRYPTVNHGRQGAV